MDHLSNTTTILLSLVSALGGAAIAAAVTFYVTRQQVAAESRRHWRGIAANAYATTLAVAAEFSDPHAHMAVSHLLDTKRLPDSYGVLRQRASDALGDLERASALSDNESIHEATDKVSRLLREVDYAWTQLVDWRTRALFPGGRKTAVASAELQVARFASKLDEHLSALYGPGGDASGALGRLRDEIRRSG